MRLNAQPENAFPSAEGSRGTNIGKGKTIDTTGSRLHLRQAAALYLIKSKKVEVPFQTISEMDLNTQS